MAMKIILYGAEDCPWTEKVKDWFEEKGIAKYKFLDVVEDIAAREEMFSKSGRYTTPAIDMDGETIDGFDKRKLQACLLK
jgi:glutaredoxin